MSPTLLKVVLFSVLSAVALAQISCWYKDQYSYTAQQVYCTTTRFCQKNYYKNQVATYGCSNICAKSGCFNDGNGYGHCCCSSSMCNSGDSKFSTSSMIFALSSIFVLYF